MAHPLWTNYNRSLRRVEPIPPALVAPVGQHVAPEILAAYNTWIKGSKEIAGLMLMTMKPEIQQNLEPFHAHEMLRELKTLSSKQSRSFFRLQEIFTLTGWKKGSLGVSMILIGLRNEYDGFVQNYNMHSMRKTVNELHAMLKLYEQTLPKNNAPALNVIRADGFVNRFMDNTIQVSRNNMVYFSAIPRDDIFEIDLSNSHTNESFIYVVSNKRAKLDLDSALLWHCRLGHISKKRIEKLQHDRLLDSSDLSRYGYVYLLKHKHEVFETFKVFQKEVENQLGKTIKSLCSDHGGKYMSQDFLDHLKDHGIIAHRTLPYTPQHNGVSERRNRTLLDMVRSMMSQTTLPKSFWDYALEIVARILNMVSNKKVEKTPYKNKVLVARNAEFLENSLINQEASRSVEDLEIIQEEDTHPSIDISLNHEKDDLEIDEPQSDIVPIRRSIRTQHVLDCMCLYVDVEEHELGDLGEPDNYKAALLDPESEKWLNAMNVEMKSIKDNEVWVIVELPPNGKSVGSNWLFKKKTDMDGNVHTYKARLVANGYTQTPGIDYEETFSPVTNIRAIRILIAIVAYYNYEIWQMDVKTAFLNGYLNEKEELRLSKSQGASTPAELKRMQNVPYASTVGSIMVSCYTNVGYLTDADDLKSQTGYVFVLNGGAVDWKSAKQSIFATSSAEDEYIATFDAFKEVVWVRKFISRPSVVPTIEEPISMYCDNTGAIAIANESGITEGTRYFRAKVHCLREVIEYGDIKLEKVHTYDNLVDPFTKALAFLKHTRNIGMLSATSGRARWTCLWSTGRGGHLVTLFHIHLLLISSCKIPTTLMFTITYNGTITLVLVYVDDILLISKDINFIKEVKTKLHDKFSIKDLGPLHYYLGIEFLRNSTSLAMTQRKYALELLECAECLRSKRLPLALSQNGLIGDSVVDVDGDEFNESVFIVMVFEALCHKIKLVTSDQSLLFGGGKRLSMMLDFYSDPMILHRAYFVVIDGVITYNPKNASAFMRIHVSTQMVQPHSYSYDIPIKSGDNLAQVETAVLPPGNNIYASTTSTFRACKDFDKGGGGSLDFDPRKIDVDVVAT
nr:hypothetical protein [Tanacetum cinerariifolium]